MRDVQKLRELLERVEKASGPDRETDIALAMALTNPRRSIAWNHFQNMRPKGSPERTEVEFWEKRAPAYTASLDASIALVERMLPGWGRMAYWNNCQGHLCAVEDNENSYKGSTNQVFEALGATSALALLAAMLKALISQAEGEGQHGS